VDRKRHPKMLKPRVPIMTAGGDPLVEKLVKATQGTTDRIGTENNGNPRKKDVRYGQIV